MDIVNVLESIRNKIEAIDPLEDRFLRSNGNDNGFEKLVPLIIQEVVDEWPSADTLSFVAHLGHHFPDVDLTLNGIKYGLELKSRNNGSWFTNGNSVLESITSEGYEEIYLMFGSKVLNEKRLAIKYAPYWQATSNIKVTHSPRFTIDMANLDKSVFRSKEEYDLLRTMNEEQKTQFLQNYLKENSIGAKWYTASNKSVSPTIFSELDLDKKNQLRAEVLILFPDDLLIGSNQDKYTRSSKYILETYFVYNKSFRDLFSAGGVFRTHNVEFPKMIGTLIMLKDSIIQTLYNASDDFFELCKEKWIENLPEELISTNLLDSYQNILDYLGTKKTYASLLEQTNIDTLSKLTLQLQTD